MTNTPAALGGIFHLYSALSAERARALAAEGEAARMREAVAKVRAVAVAAEAMCEEGHPVSALNVARRVRAALAPPDRPDAGDGA